MLSTVTKTQENTITWHEPLRPTAKAQKRMAKGSILSKYSICIRYFSVSHTSLAAGRFSRSSFFSNK